MRIAGVCLVLLLSACGAHAPTVVDSPTAVLTPRATTAATRDCPNVDWLHHYRSLAQVRSDAELVVRATAIAQDTVQLMAFGGGATVSYRDARRTTFRVTSAVRTNGPAPDEIRVLEDVCPNLEVRPGEEWLLFLYRFDPKYGPVGQSEPHFMSAGGPQSQFRLTGGIVVGPFYTFADLVHSYDGAPVGDVIRDIP